MFSGEIDHDPADERAIVVRYREWLEARDSLLVAVEIFEALAITFEGSEELRACREMAG